MSQGITSDRIKNKDEVCDPSGETEKIVIENDTREEPGHGDQAQSLMKAVQKYRAYTKSGDRHSPAKDLESNIARRGGSRLETTSQAIVDAD